MVLTRPAVLKIVEDWKVIYLSTPMFAVARILNEAKCWLLRLGFCFVLQWLGRSDERLYLSRSEWEI
jgi:hypothetical protein